MKILDVSPVTVSPPAKGGAVRIYNILRHLPQNYEIRQFSQIDSSSWSKPNGNRKVDIAPSYMEYRYENWISEFVSEYCKRTWAYLPVFYGAVLQICRPKLLDQLLDWSDLILVEYPWQFSYFRNRRQNRKIIYSAHNVEASTRLANALAMGKVVDRKPLYRHCVKLEKAAVSQADLVLAVSERDKQEFIRLYGKDPNLIEVIPNGADTANIGPVSDRQKTQLKKDLGLPRKHTVLYLASNDKPPHQAGLDWVRRVARRLNDCTFLIVGGLFATPEVSGNIIATGYVDSPVRYLQAADISICPIQYGGGTKIKVLESLAAGLPTICFEETLLGTSLNNEQHVMVADKNENSIITSILRLFSNRGLKEHLINEGRKIVCEKYDWKRISEKLDSILRRVTAQ